jgi:hypothetical protein
MKQNRVSMRPSKKALLRKAAVKAVKQRRRKPAGLTGKLVRSERRHETRKPKISPCTYGLMRSVNNDGAVLEEGQGASVNNSSTGMRLLLGVALLKGQMLEVQTGHSSARQALCLVEVCWTKPLRKNVQGALYLVGCRQNFGIMYDEAI